MILQIWTNSDHLWVCWRITIYVVLAHTIWLVPIVDTHLERPDWGPRKISFSINILKVARMTKPLGEFIEHCNLVCVFFRTMSTWIITADFIVYLPCIRHCSKYFICITYFNLHNNFRRSVWLRNSGTERGTNTHMVPELPEQSWDSNQGALGRELPLAART